MVYGALTSQFDVAFLTLLVFFLFFVLLITYLRREDRREGYPLVSEKSGNKRFKSFAFMPAPKKFLLKDGRTISAPRPEVAPPIAATEVGIWQGLPIEPTGDAMIDGVGAAAYAHRADVPDMAFTDGKPRIVPLRLLPDYFLATNDPDPRGFAVVGADRAVAGHVRDVWIDRAEDVVRYIEVDVGAGAALRRVLVPMPLAVISRKAKTVTVKTILAAQFATVPLAKNGDTVTLLEEDRISAYFGGGQLHATPSRADPLI